jgi:nicotinate-nucleotide adenylyltransferase
MKIAFYGGTFDPIHHGHLIVARDAVEQLDLDRLIFIPNTISPHKQTRLPTPPEIRMEMVKAATAGEPHFEADPFELHRGGTSFTIDTIVEMKNRFPDTEMFYLIGEDNIPELPTWRRIDELSHLVQFVVLCRGEVNAVHPYISLGRRIDISATNIRERIAKGLSVRYLVPEAVLAIVNTHQLYRDTAPSNP